jgi:hypothetical protein
MPILLKKIDGSLISLIGSGTSDLTGEVILIKSIIGETGVEDYIKLTALEALVQDFSSVIDGEFCDITPTFFGVIGCPTHITLNLSY